MAPTVAPTWSAPTLPHGREPIDARAQLRALLSERVEPAAQRRTLAAPTSRVRTTHRV